MALRGLRHAPRLVWQQQVAPMSTIPGSPFSLAAKTRVRVDDDGVEKTSRGQTLGDVVTTDLLNGGRERSAGDVGKFYLDPRTFRSQEFYDRFTVDLEEVEEYVMLRESTLELIDYVKQAEENVGPRVVHVVGSVGMGVTTTLNQVAQIVDTSPKNWMTINIPAEVAIKWAHGGDFVQRRPDGVFDQPELYKEFLEAMLAGDAKDVPFKGEFDFEDEGGVRRGATLGEILSYGLKHNQATGLAVEALRTTLSDFPQRILVLIDGYDRFFGDSHFTDTTVDQHRMVPARQMKLVQQFSNFATLPVKNGLVVVGQESAHTTLDNPIEREVRLKPYSLNEFRSSFAYYHAMGYVAYSPTEERDLYRFFHLSGGVPRDWAKLAGML